MKIKSPNLNSSAFSSCKAAITVIVLIVSASTVSAQEILTRRADCFFGVHFDFHAKITDTGIGRTLTPEMVNDFLQNVKPDFIQVDSKGVHGISSYPTKVGVAAPGMLKDPLRIFRDATEKRGVALYTHFIGIGDQRSIKDHPDWARLTASGQEGNTASIFSDYYDKYFIPQIEEEIRNYHINGVWIDGDAYAMQTDYSPEAIQAYKKATGKRPPRSESDPAYINYVEFSRQAYRKAAAHYIEVLHKYDPTFQICIDWAYSAYMPGPVDSHIDFLSGDLDSLDPDEVDYEVRVLASHGLPWDLMAWARPDALPLEKKAAATICLGGAYEIYLQQNHDASIPASNYNSTRETGEFCRARKPYCFQTKPIPQVVVFLSAYGYNKESTSVFQEASPCLLPVKEADELLLNMQYSVQILQESQLSGNLSKYPLIVIPGWKYIAPSFLSELKLYVRNGGKLLIAGNDANNLFKDIETVNVASNLNTNGMPVKAFKYGNGLIAGIFVDFSMEQLAAKRAEIKNMVSLITNKLFTNPVITVDGSSVIHVNATTKNGEKQFHLINAGINGNTTPPLNVKLNLGTKPSAIILQPDNKSLPFSYSNGVAQLNVPGVYIYSILEVK